MPDPTETTTSPTDWVDPFLGNAAADLPQPEGIAASWWCAKPPVGNTHPGATLPFGMVSVSAYSGAYVTGYGSYDVSLSGDPPERLFSEHTLLGLAHFQQTGTGRIRQYYNYLLTTPLLDPGLSGLGERCRLTNEKARPGHYSGRFEEPEIDFEVTCTKRTAVHRYTFPEDVAGTVAIDLSAGGLQIFGMSVYPSMASLRWLDSQNVTGRVEIEGIPYHFHIRCLSETQSASVWEGTKRLETCSDWNASRELREERARFGVCFTAAEAGTPMELRIGFSLHDPERPSEALRRSADRSLQEIANGADQMWQSILGRIEIEGATDEQREIFYSALYHATLKPGDFMDENPFTGEPGPFFFDLSTLWDLYKTQLPLLMTLWPELGADFVAFLVEVGRREGGFPISYLMDNAPERFAKQATGLCHIILADAQMRGIEGDWDRVLNLLWKTSESGRGRRGRFAEFDRDHVVHPLSHTLDLAFANWCIAQLAKRLGDQVIYDLSIPRSHYWTNAFDSETGLLRTDSDYYEGTHWNYSFRFLHDMIGRIKLAGGEKRFVELLDLFFGFREPAKGETVDRFEGLNNEPDMEAPYAYIYAGRHDRTAEIVRSVLQYQFTTGVGGLPGNDDSGGLSSWYVWSAIGIFPVTGLPV
ncbi:MAG: glycoside hydrolase domain-containing protein, partial [Verrucomicrobiota bacterium]